MKVTINIFFTVFTFLTYLAGPERKIPKHSPKWLKNGLFDKRLVARARGSVRAESAGSAEMRNKLASDAFRLKQNRLSHRK